MIIMSYPNNVIKKSKSKRNEYALLSDQNLLNSNDNRNYNFLDVNSNNNIDSEYHKLNKTNGKKKGEWFYFNFFYFICINFFNIINHSLNKENRNMVFNKIISLL